MNFCSQSYGFLVLYLGSRFMSSKSKFFTFFDDLYYNFIVSRLHDFNNLYASENLDAGSSDFSCMCLSIQLRHAGCEHVSIAYGFHLNNPSSDEVFGCNNVFEQYGPFAKAEPVFFSFQAKLSKQFLSCFIKTLLDYFFLFIN